MSYLKTNIVSSLILLLMLSCSKDDIIQDTVVDNFTPISWKTLSERFSSINETTGYFKSQEYFDGYLSKQYLNNLSFSDNGCTYRVFHRNSTIIDFDGDDKQDLIAFASAFCQGGYSLVTGKFIFISNYKVNTNRIILDSNYRFGGKFEVNDFTGDNISDVLLFATEAKFNSYSSQEGEGGNTNFEPLAPFLLYFENGSILTKTIGLPGEFHSGTSGDIDNDGDIDFIMWDSPSVYNNEAFQFTPSVAINNGDLNFSTYSMNISREDWYVTSVDLFDIDSDDFLDLVLGWRAGTTKYNDINPTYTNSLSGPVILYGDGSGNFSDFNSDYLYESFLSNRDITATILSHSFTDYDLDGDIDIIVNTTRDEPNGRFDNGTYYDNYYLILLENNNNIFTDVTESKFDFSYDQSLNFPNFYSVRSIDINFDGVYDLIPDGIANWGEINYSNTLRWLNIGGKFIRNN